MAARCYEHHRLQKRCPPQCEFRDFFPQQNPAAKSDFDAAVATYGKENLQRILSRVDAEGKGFAVEGMVFEARRREEDPRGGTYAILRRLEEEAVARNQQLQDLQGETIVLNQQVEELEGDITQLQQELANVKAELAAYRGASTGRKGILLFQGSMGQESKTAEETEVDKESDGGILSFHGTVGTQSLVAGETEVHPEIVANDDADKCGVGTEQPVLAALNKQVAGVMVESSVLEEAAAGPESSVAAAEACGEGSEQPVLGRAMVVFEPPVHQVNTAGERNGVVAGEAINTEGVLAQAGAGGVVVQGVVWEPLEMEVADVLLNMQQIEDFEPE